MKRVQLQPAYVLHRRPYRETSYLVEFLTQDHGRMAGIARGVRKPKSSTQGLLQPFVPIMVSWSGKGELMTITEVEPNGLASALKKESLFAGFYLNELMMALLEKWDPHSALFEAYKQALCGLQTATLDERILRSFEKRLLEELGYGLLPKSDNSLHNTFSPEAYYRFIPEQGFVVCDQGQEMHGNKNVFLGKSLHAIAKEDWHYETSLQDAKRLIRFVLAPLLGVRTLHSRKLFMTIQTEE